MLPSFDLANILYSSDVKPSVATFDFFLVPMPQSGNNRIVFTSNRDGNAQIYSMDSNGSNLTRLTNNGSNDDHPRWSPNGAKVLFQSDRDNPETGNYDVYVMNADGSGQTRLTTDAADDCDAVWSADGIKIVFQSFRSGAYYQVYVMNADGSGQVNRSNGTSNDYQPNWSPNGSKIAFASERDHAGAPSIYLMNADGSSQTRLTFSSELVRDEQPVWSHDATKLAFVSTRDGNKEIYLMNANGSNQVALTTTLENDDTPYWSPDGTKIVFRSERERDSFDPIQQLWIMNVDGSSQAIISSNAYGDYSPSWSNPTGNQSPIANSGGPYSGVVAQNVPFSGTGSFDSDGTITSYAWNFGDGGTGSGVSPTHAYGSAGTYNVSLTVTDNLGAQTSASTSTTITTAGSEQYLANFCQLSLGRQPSANESSYWNDILRAAYPNGQTSMVLSLRELGKTVFESSEYAALGRSNHWYVYDLYKTYLIREPDAPGWAFWEGVCNSNGRENVRRAFDECSEFAGIVSTLTPSGSPSSTVSSLASARVDLFNQPGNGLASRDAEWSVPLLSLPGRAGLDLGLSLSYSSMIWTRSGPYIYFDDDNGWPSPGFRLGFPAIQEKFFDAQAGRTVSGFNVPGRNVYLMIAGGSRVSLRQVDTSNVYEAADSSYLQLIDNGSSLLLRTTDGKQLSYLVFNNEWRCTQIKDRNGNYITVNYDWLGHITTIIDTLARTITFNYDANANLISITQSWTVNGVATPHTWVSFGWDTKTIQPSFSGASVVGVASGSSIPVLKQVGFDDSTYCKFLYNSAGQVSSITHYASDSNPLSDNHPRNYTSYDYTTASDDCPRVSATHVWAENWTGINGVPSEVVTQYGVEGSAHTSYVAGDPNSTLYKVFYGPSNIAWQRGLAVQSEVWAGGVKQKWTTTSWTQDNTGVNYQTNPRVTESNIYDGTNHRRTTVSYSGFTLSSGASCSLPKDVREYAGDAATVLRRSHTEYQMDPTADAAYLERHIIGLAKEQSLYEVSGGSETLMSRLGFQYDENGSIQGDDAPVSHDNDTSIGYRANFLVGRANLSSVKRYDVTDTSQFTLSSLKYNTAGAIVYTTDPLSRHTTVSYADSFSDGNNGRNTLAYPKTITDADGYSSTIIYNFDFAGVTSKQTPQPNTTQNLPGPVQTITYDGAGRIERVTATTNNAYTRYVYGPTYVQSFATVNSVADEAYSNAVFDGLGRTVVAAGNHPGSSGGYSAENTIYDLMGRAVKQSNPTETNGSWTPAGDDLAGWLYTQQTYDWKGRPRITTNTDLTTKEASYTGCGCAGGEVVTLTDEGTLDAGVAKRRQQKIYADIFGRTVKTEVLNWQGGSVYSTTINTYNARDQIKLIRQYQGDESSDVYQETTTTYDGYGRLQAKHVPQQDVNTNTSYAYYADDTVLSLTDARGAAATYSYNNRHLITGISYSAPTGVTPASNVSFGYDAPGNRISMIDGLGGKNYEYDQLSRLTAETRTISGVGTYPITYAYNLAGQLTSVTDPFNAQVGYNHDVVGRVTNVTGSNFANLPTYASNLQYRASGALKHLDYGNTRTLSMTYNARMQPATFEVPGVMSKSYDYQPDGQRSFSHDLIDAKFDRSYLYDHAGRITEALSGAEARHEGATNLRPYNENFVYDALNHLVERPANHVWSGEGGAFSPPQQTYQNERNTVWQYDADGNLVDSGEVQYTIDAAGRVSNTVSLTVIPYNGNPYSTVWGITADQTQSFDGDGQVIKKVVAETTHDNANGDETTTNTTYLVRSTVLGGKVISENASETGQRGFVYLGAEVLAWQLKTGSTEIVKWEHRDPQNGSFRLSFSNGAIDGSQKAELDPLNANAGTSDPTTLPSLKKLSLYPGWGEAAMSGDTQCVWDGLELPCSIYADAKNAGQVAGYQRGFNEFSRPTGRFPDPAYRGLGQPPNPFHFDNAAEYGDSVAASQSPLWISGEAIDVGFGHGYFAYFARAPQNTVTTKEYTLSHTAVLDLVRANNQSTASNGIILCQAYKESRAQGFSVGTGRNRRWYSPPLGTFNNASQGSVSHRGLMQVGPVAAQLGGLGNGQGEGLSDARLQSVNPDYINNIWDPAANIRAGTGYMQYLMDHYSIDAGGALQRFRGSPGSATAQAYASNILDCAARVDAGDTLGGLGLIR